MATTYNFTTLERFEKKIAKLAADHNLELTEVDKTIAVRRLQEAYNEILGALMSRGLTAVQISTWARGEEFQLDIAMFWYAKDSGWGGKLVDEVDWTKVFDRREELKTVAIINNDGILLLAGKAVADGQDLITTNESLGIYP